MNASWQIDKAVVFGTTCVAQGNDTDFFLQFTHERYSDLKGNKRCCQTYG